MRDPLNKTITTIQPSGIRKFFDVVHEMKDAISLGVGEPDFDTPWHIRDEGIYSLEKGKTHYTSNAGLKELKVEIDPGTVDHSFCNSPDAGKYLSAALYNGGYHGCWPGCRCGGSCRTGCC